MKVLALLLVEDEPKILEFLEDAFSDAGFEVVMAADGRKAIAELEDCAGRFCGVVTDIRLGEGPDGWEVACRARELSSDTPIVYMSGDSGHHWSSRGVPNSVMVLKPFVAAQVITAVSTLMNRTDGNVGS